jgi:hypothetical protein
MAIDPLKIPYISRAGGWLGPITEDNIQQLGEPISAVQTPFQLMPNIPAQQNIRLAA